MNNQQPPTRKPPRNWQTGEVTSDGSPAREELLEHRARAFGFCEVTGMSLSLAKRIIRVGSDRFIAADFLSEDQRAEAVRDLPAALQAMQEREEAIGELKDAIEGVNDQIEGLENYRDDLEYELRQLCESN